MTKFNPSEHLSAARQGGANDYLQVKWRLVWFREEWPYGTIESQHIELSDTHAIFRATVTKQDADGKDMGSATDYGSESQKDFRDYVEKASTKAIGRALAALGYGTQFAPELDEGARIVDSPVERRSAPQKASQAPAQAPAKVTPINGNGDGKPVTKAQLDRMHAILGNHGLEHHHLKAYAVVHVGRESSRDLTQGELAKLEDGLVKKTAASVAYLKKLANDLELK